MSKNLENLMKELETFINTEKTFVDLDNFMQEETGYSALDDISPEELLDNGSISYYWDDNTDINIEFKINYLAGLDSELFITKIETI